LFPFSKLPRTLPSLIGEDTFDRQKEVLHVSQERKDGLGGFIILVVARKPQLRMRLLSAEEMSAKGEDHKIDRTDSVSGGKSEKDKAPNKRVRFLDTEKLGKNDGDTELNVSSEARKRRRFSEGPPLSIAETDGGKNERQAYIPSASEAAPHKEEEYNSQFAALASLLGTSSQNQPARVPDHRVEPSRLQYEPRRMEPPLNFQGERYSRKEASSGNEFDAHSEFERRRYDHDDAMRRNEWQQTSVALSRQLSGDRRHDGRPERLSQVGRLENDAFRERFPQYMNRGPEGFEHERMPYDPRQNFHHYREPSRHSEDHTVPVGGRFRHHDPWEAQRRNPNADEERIWRQRQLEERMRMQQ